MAGWIDGGDFKEPCLLLEWCSSMEHNLERLGIDFAGILYWHLSHSAVLVAFIPG